MYESHYPKLLWLPWLSSSTTSMCQQFNLYQQIHNKHRLYQQNHTKQYFKLSAYLGLAWHLFGISMTHKHEQNDMTLGGTTIPTNRSWTQRRGTERRWREEKRVSHRRTGRTGWFWDTPGFLPFFLMILEAKSSSFVLLLRTQIL